MREFEETRRQPRGWHHSEAPVALRKWSGQTWGCFYGTMSTEVLAHVTNGFRSQHTRQTLGYACTGCTYVNCRRRGRLRAALPALADLVHLGAALEGPEVVDLREGVVAHLVSSDVSK